MARNLIVAGVGSRATPAEILADMQDLGGRIAARGWTVRSGGADGADKAFERGAGPRTVVYLPAGWERWAPDMAPRCGGRAVQVTQVNAPEAFASVYDYHPAPERLGRGGLGLMARNWCQVMGMKGDPQTDAVVCWAPVVGGAVQGGTAQAIRIATEFGVPVWNLAECPATPREVEGWLLSLADAT